MTKFTFNDFRCLEKCPTSPKQLQGGISSLVFSSVNTKAKVESCNPETGEYRIVLHGTLDMDSPIYGYTPGF
jgi:hypothetical protein